MNIQSATDSTPNPTPTTECVYVPTGVPQTVLSTMSQLPRPPRPFSPYMVSQTDNQTGLPNVTPIDMPNKDNESQQSQLYPSLLSGVPQHNNPAISTNTTLSSDKSTTTATNVFINTPGSSEAIQTLVITLNQWISMMHVEGPGMC